MRKQKHIHFTVKPKVHFMGIGGSGVSAAALLAQKEGYQVTGCDLQAETPYLDKVVKAKIDVFKGHDTSHLNDVDLLVTTPAVFYQSSQHPELIEARNSGRLLVLRQFLGEYLFKNKRVVSIAGTHGKGTTTAMTGLVFEDAGLDPSVFVGATVKKWRSNFRSGKSDIFITESDEFYDSFLYYRPDVIILNNIEFDHPDYFKSEKEMVKSFAKHVNSLKGDKVFIFNQDSPGIKKLFKILGDSFLSTINVLGYTLDDMPQVSTPTTVRGKIIRKEQGRTIFR